MIEWVVRLFQEAGDTVAGLCISKDRFEFDVISTIASTLILAAILCLLLVYGKFLIDYWRFGRRPRE
jgi:hypothetical protein